MMISILSGSAFLFGLNEEAALDWGHCQVGLNRWLLGAAVTDAPLNLLASRHYPRCLRPSLNRSKSQQQLALGHESLA